MDANGGSGECTDWGHGSNDGRPRRTVRSAADIVCWSREAPPHSPASSFGLVLPALRDERAADVQAAILLAQCCNDGCATFMANAVG